MKCTVCLQPILAGEPIDDFCGDLHHENPAHCVAATARRCAEITENSPTALIAIERIKAEFKLEPKQ